MTSIAERREAVKAAFDAKNDEQAKKREEIAAHQQEINRLESEIAALMPDLYRLQGQYTAYGDMETEAADPPSTPPAAPAEPRLSRRPRPRARR